MTDQPSKPQAISDAYSIQAHANNAETDISYKSGAQSEVDKRGSDNSKGLVDEHFSSQGGDSQFFGAGTDKSNQDQPDKLESK